MTKEKLIRSCVIQKFQKKHKSYVIKPKTVTTSSLASVKKLKHKNKQTSKRKTMRNISNYLDKGAIDSKKNDSISLNLRKKTNIHKKHYKEVKNKNNSGKSKAAKDTILSNKVEDKKLLISPIVLLDILPLDNIKKTSTIKEINASGSIKRPDADFLEKSSHSEIRKNICKTDVQNISDRQTCISRTEVNTNKQPTAQLINISNDNKLTRNKLKMLDNSVLAEQINNKNTHRLKINESSKETLIEQKKCSVNKLQCDSVTDQQMCISRTESNAKKQSYTQQKLISQSHDNQLTGSKVKVHENSVLVEQINDKKSNKETLIEQETCPVSRKVINSGDQESLLEKKRYLENQITTKKNSFNQTANLQEKYIESVKTLINNKEQKNCKDKHISIIQEIINDFTEDEEIITEKECAMDTIESEKIQNVNECVESNQNNCFKTKHNKTENNKKNLFDSKENNKIISIIDNEPLIESCKTDLRVGIHEEISWNSVTDDVSNVEDNDEDDEEIIFYYINSANEVIKKIDSKKGNFNKINKMKDVCITPPAVEKCERNVKLYQSTIDDEEVIINNQHNKNGFKNSIHIDKSVLNKEQQIVNVNQSEISIKDLDRQIVRNNVININKPSINKENKNREVDLRIPNENDHSIDIGQPALSNTTTEKIINISANLINDKEKILNTIQPENQCIVEKCNISNDEETVNKNNKIAIDQSIEATKETNINLTAVNKNSEIPYVEPTANIDKNGIVKIGNLKVPNKRENINVDLFKITKKDKTLKIEKIQLNQKNESNSTSEFAGTEKKNKVSIIKKHKNIKIKKTAFIEKTNNIKINHHAITKNDKSMTINQSVNDKEVNSPDVSGVMETDAISKDNQIIISRKDKISNIQTFVDVSKDNTNVCKPSSTDNEKTINICQSPVIENVDTLTVNELLNKKNNESMNVAQSSTTGNNATIEIDQSLLTEKEKIINISQNEITTEHITEQMYQHTINETNLSSEIKIEEVLEIEADEIIDQSNLYTNSDDRNIHIYEDVMYINNDNVSNNTMMDDIKVENVDIPEDDIIGNNSESGAINNLDTSINASKSLQLSESDPSNDFIASEDERNIASIQPNNSNINNDEQENSISENEYRSDGSMDRSNAMFISFMQAYHSMRRDVNAANSLLTLNGDSDDINYADVGPEILYIADDSDNEITILEEKNEESLNNQELDDVIAINPALPINISVSSVNLVNPINPVKRKILLPNGGAIISASKLYGCEDGISIQEKTEHLFHCPKCNRTYKGEESYNKHKLKCNQEIQLACIFCSKRLKNRRSVFDHLKKVHRSEIMNNNIKNIVNNIFLEAKFRLNTRTPTSVCMLDVPEFVKLFCNNCGKIYNRIRSDYYRACKTCNVPLLLYCRRCNTRCAVTPEASSHINGDCDPGEPIMCPHCNFVSRQRYQIHKHIEETHKAPLSIRKEISCTKGCGRKFESNLGMQRHRKYCGTKPNLRCKFCKYKTRHRSAIKMHMQQHVLRNDMEINQEFSESDSSDSSRVPILGVDENGVRELMQPFCLTCNKTVPMPPKYMNNCDTCGMRLQFNCKKCHLVTSRSHDYRHVRVHVIRCHTEKIYKCPSCRRRFAYFYDYNYHKEKCDKNMSFRCKLCPYRSNLLKGLQAHMKRIHRNGKLESSLCSKCHTKFDNRASLLKHVCIYNYVNYNFFCAHCEFRTKSKFSLTRHIQNKHSEIFEKCQFQCVYCNKVYSNLYAHDTHVIICPKKPRLTPIY